MITVAKGFNNVIDAFHAVNTETIPVQFYSKDYGKTGKRIILTDNIFKLQELLFYGNYASEADVRWNLVEAAWELGISRNLLNVRYDDASKIFFVNNNLKRKDVYLPCIKRRGRQRAEHL